MCYIFNVRSRVLETVFDELTFAKKDEENMNLFQCDGTGCETIVKDQVPSDWRKATLKIGDETVDEKPLLCPPCQAKMKERFSHHPEIASTDPSTTPKSIDQVEQEHILATLEHTKWNKSQAAHILGIERSTLDRKLKKYEVERPSA